MVVVLAVARLMGRVFRAIGQPELVGEMAAGILLGPSLLGRVAPAAMNILFPSNGLGALNLLSQVGIVLFMFLVGLESQPGALRGFAKSAVLTSQASIAAPFLLGAVLGLGLYERLGNGVPKLPFVLFLGAAMGVTAFPVLARILAERQLTRTRVGMFAIACAAVNDLTAWCLLAVITVVARPGANGHQLPWRFAALAAYIALMVFLVRPALRRLIPPEKSFGITWFGTTMIFLFVSVWATEALGVHALFGAFLAGTVMPKTERLEEELRTRLESVTLTLFLPLFFAYTGLHTSIALLNRWDLWLLCILVVVAAVASKLGSQRGDCSRWRDAVARIVGGRSACKYEGAGGACNSECRTGFAYSVAGTLLHDGDHGPGYDGDDNAAAGLDSAVTPTRRTPFFLGRQISGSRVYLSL